VKAGLLIGKIISHLRQKPFVYNKRLIFECSMHAQISPISPKLPVEFRFGSTENTNQLMIPPKTNENELNEQEIYVNGTLNEKKIYHMRISLARDTMIHLLPCCHVPEKVAFIYDCYTDPQFRGYGIFSGALNYFLRYLQCHKFDKAYIRVHPRNTFSIKGIERAGFRLLGKAYHLSFFGFPLKPCGRVKSAS